MYVRPSDVCGHNCALTVSKIAQTKTSKIVFISGYVYNNVLCLKGVPFFQKCSSLK